LNLSAADDEASWTAGLQFATALLKER